jgi:adenosylcobinamide-GDP ribazoletransferase
MDSVGVKQLVEIFGKFASAIAFYTCIPIPSVWALDFAAVARLAPLVGVLVGGLLGGLDVGLQEIGIPILTRSAIVVALWVWITGGLHLDGAMDTADGLAVIDPQRRLEVMADSRTGAFGAIAAVTLLLLKTCALSEVTQHRWLALLLVAGWGRWGQQVAIAWYPYLKATGKGAFHKAAIQSIWQTLPSLALLIGLSASPLLLDLALNLGVRLATVWQSGGLLLGGAIALLTVAWFGRKLGGYTGDSYGAVVEWTEAIGLVVLTGLL